MSINEERDKSIDDYSTVPAKTTTRTPAEVKFTNKLMGLYEEAYVDRQQRAGNWETYNNFVRGRNQWPKRRPSYKVSALMNFMPSNLERKAALLTDTKPRIEIKPRKAGLDDTAIILTKCIDAVWDEREVAQKLVELALQTQTFGNSFTNTLYDRELDGGTGDIDIAVRDPRAVLIDPGVRRSYLLADGEYVILEDTMPLSVARDRWPKRSDLIKPAPEFSMYTPQRNTSIVNRMLSHIWRPSRQSDAVPSEIPRCVIREFWIKDRSQLANGRPRFRKQCRKVTMINDIIVSDGPNPYWDGYFPIDMIDWHIDMDSAWGWGDVELLKGPQELINKIVAVTVENAIMMSNAIWIGDADALSKKDWEKLSNEPGSNVRVRPGKELKREPGVALPNHVFQLAEYFKSVGIDELSGMVDVMKGMRTGQVESGVAIESLQLMAQSLIRLKARALESLMKRIGQKLISRIFQFYTSDRILNMIGTDDKFRQFGFVRSELVKRHSGREEDAFKDFQFMVVPGSSLAMSKMQKVMMATQLFQMGLIDELELLQTMDYPNAERVAAKAVKRRQEMMQMQGQQGGPGDKGKSNVTSFPNQVGARGGPGAMG